MLLDGPEHGLPGSGGNICLSPMHKSRQKLCVTRLTCPVRLLPIEWAQTRFLELRPKSHQAMGSKFDIRQFHNWILDSGPMPMAVLQEHVNWAIEQTARKMTTPNLTRPNAIRVATFDGPGAPP